MSIFLFFVSYDARSKPVKRWSDAVGGFGGRAHFRVQGLAPAHLRLENVEKSEQGIYRCRVDFKTAPTRNSLLNLTVIGKCKTGVINDPLGQTHYLVSSENCFHLKLVLFC